MSIDRRKNKFEFMLWPNAAPSRIGLRQDLMLTKSGNGWKFNKNPSEQAGPERRNESAEIKFLQ